MSRNIVSRKARQVITKGDGKVYIMSETVMGHLSDSKKAGGTDNVDLDLGWNRSNHYSYRSIYRS